MFVLVVGGFDCLALILGGLTFCLGCGVIVGFVLIMGFGLVYCAYCGCVCFWLYFDLLVGFVW